MQADLVVLDAVVATMDPDRPQAEAVAVKDGRIIAVGADRLVRALAGAGTLVLEARGRRLIPGLIDSHMHLLGYGLHLERIGLSSASSLAEVQGLVREQAARAPRGTWILGGGWDEGRLGGLPTRQLLDAATSDHPVFLTRHCYHVGAANSAALDAAGFWSTVSIPGGIIDRDESGRPTGILREKAKDRMDQAIPPLRGEDYRRLLRAAARSAAAHGLTSVHSNDGQNYPLAEVLAAYEELTACSDPLPLRVWWDFAADDLPEAVARGWQSGFGSDWFRVGAVKLFGDGSLGGRTAALREPYRDDPGNRGLLIWSTAELAERLAEARRHGFQAAVHAIGDHAQEQALDAYERAIAAADLPGNAGPAAGRLRLIHCQVSSPALWRRMRGLGVVADVQPRFVSSDYPIIEARVGAARAATSYAWRSMAAAGVPLAFSSDCPVEPVNPMHGIYAAVTRQTMDGAPTGGWLPEERLSVDEAIAMHTRGAAYAVGEEGYKGQIRPGYLADMALLEQDPWRIAAAELKDIAVAWTIAGGRLVYGG